MAGRSSPIRAQVQSLLAEQSLAVLATVGDPHPHTSLVAVAAARDLRTILFATPVYTRKYENLRRNGAVALLLDNRRNREADFKDALALTAKGQAAEVPPSDRKRRSRQFLRRHPYLEAFVNSPSCGLFAVEVESYSLVSSFQNVREWHLRRAPST